MNNPTKFIFATCLIALTSWAQPIAILEVDVEGVAYLVDSTDFTKIARSPVPAPPAIMPPPNYFSYVNISDVTRVNGKPARGTQVIHGFYVRMSPNPTAGIAIADSTRNNFAVGQLEIQDADGRDVGTISLQGWFGGSAPSGASAELFSNLTVVGGTGAFLGVRGQASHAAVVMRPGARPPGSITEDPSVRRTFGNQGTITYTIQLIPQSAPQIEKVYHMDFQPVSPSNPAQRGETLIVQARGLAPIAGAKFGDPAPEPPADISAPVEVLLGGRPAQVVNKVGWPGTVDTYRVDFRVPDEASGEVDLKLSTAWIPAPVVKIAVR
jgi:hypothetical protein